MLGQKVISTPVEERLHSSTANTLLVEKEQPHASIQSNESHESVQRKYISYTSAECGRCPCCLLFFVFILFFKRLPTSCTHLESLLLETLGLQEAGDRGVLRLGDGGEDGVGGLEVFPHHGSLLKTNQRENHKTKWKKEIDTTRPWTQLMIRAIRTITHTYRHRIGIHHQDEKIETKKLHQVAKNKQHRLHQSKTLSGGRKAQAKKKCTPIRTHNKR